MSEQMRKNIVATFEGGPRYKPVDAIPNLTRGEHSSEYISEAMAPTGRCNISKQIKLCIAGSLMVVLALAIVLVVVLTTDNRYSSADDDETKKIVAVNLTKLAGTWSTVFTNGARATFAIKPDGEISFYGGKTVLEPSDDQVNFPSSKGWMKGDKLWRDAAWSYYRVAQDGTLEVQHFRTDDTPNPNNFHKLDNYCCSGIGHRQVPTTSTTSTTKAPGHCTGLPDEMDGCCTREKPCGVGHGDCDNDDECAGNLICSQTNNCKDFDPQAHVGADCCIEPVAVNLTKLAGTWSTVFTNGVRATFAIKPDGEISFYKFYKRKTVLEPSDDQVNFPSSEGWMKGDKLWRDAAWSYYRVAQDGTLEVQHFRTDDTPNPNNFHKLDNYCCSGIGHRQDETTQTSTATTTTASSTDLGSCDISKCSSSHGCPVVKNNLMTTVQELNKEFYISFEFKATEYISGWQSLIHFTKGENIGDGGRVPAVFVLDSGKLYPCFSVNGNSNYHIGTAKNYPVGQWHHMEFYQTLTKNKYIYHVKINGESVIKIENSQPKIFSNVKVYVGDNWYHSMKGSIKNLFINTKKSNKCIDETTKTSTATTTTASSTGCDDQDNALTDLSSVSAMRSNGWRLDFTHPNAVTNDVGKHCNAHGQKTKWFGWSSWNNVGTLSATFTKSGVITVDFGNCWNAGNVKLYKDSEVLATAHVGSKSVVKSFAFNPGSVIKLQDEDGNAVVMLNSISLKCQVAVNLTKLAGTWSTVFTNGVRATFTIKPDGEISFYRGKTVLEPSDDQVNFPSSEGWMKGNKLWGNSKCSYYRVAQDGTLEVQHFHSDKISNTKNFKNLDNYCCSGIGHRQVDCNGNDPVIPVCPAYATGDLEGGIEVEISFSPKTEASCRNACKDKHPTSIGVTLTPDESRCYCEFAPIYFNGCDKKYKTCAFPTVHSELLHKDSEYNYFKVPMAVGSNLTSDLVLRTCKQHGMVPQCLSLSHADSNCVLSPTGSSSTVERERERERGFPTTNVSEMSKIICNTYSARKCPSMSNMFWYMNNWNKGSACGLVQGSYCTSGWLRSSIDEQYFAACLQERT